MSRVTVSAVCDSEYRDALFEGVLAGLVWGVGIGAAVCGAFMVSMQIVRVVL